MPNALGKKIGPLPTWAYLVGGIAFVGMVWYMRKNASDTSASVSVDTSSDPLAAPAGAGSGFDSPSGSGSLYGSDVTYSTDPNAGGMPVGYPPDFWSGLLASMTPNQSAIYESPTSPYQTQPITQSGGTQTLQAPTASSTKQTSFEWGGKTWTHNDLAAFRTWLKAHGVSYAQWANNHPKAAMDVFGTMK